MAISNATKNTNLASKVNFADNFFTRLVGLLLRKSLPEGEALVITPANCIHSFFMRFSIDLIFLDKDNNVIGMFEDFKPFRTTKVFLKARRVIELPAGTIRKTSTHISDHLIIEE